MVQDHVFDEAEILLIEEAQEGTGKVFLSVGVSVGGEPRPRPSARPYPPARDFDLVKYHALESLVKKGVFRKEDAGVYALIPGQPLSPPRG